LEELFLLICDKDVGRRIGLAAGIVAESLEKVWEDSRHKQRNYIVVLYRTLVQSVYTMQWHGRRRKNTSGNWQCLKWQCSEGFAE